MPELWFVLDMDDGVGGVFHTKRDAVRSRLDREHHTVKVHRYGPGAYEYHWHYKGDPYDGSEFFLERLDPDNARDWQWAVDAWKAAGSPTEPFLTIDRPEER